MAILKHIASKNADYGEAQRYLIFQHDEYTGKPVLDENGNMQIREEYYLGGVECGPFSFDMECRELNARFHKNRAYNEIKSHHYIISFDPKDRDECGLAGERAQQLGLEYCKKNFPGHQTLVCTHTDGHNGSGNIHVHIVINSLRKNDVERQDFMERDCDSRAGGRFSYLHPDREKPITGRSLGTHYEKDYLMEVIGNNSRLENIEKEQTVQKENPHSRKHSTDRQEISAGTDAPTVTFGKSGLRLVTDLQNCIKAQQSKAYANKVKLSNLQNMAKTLSYIQEHGYDTLESMEGRLAELKGQTSTSLKELKDTEARLRQVNEQIHYTGQYLANKSVYAQLQKSKNKAQFRQENSAKIALYETALKFLKEKAGDGKLPTLQTLKAEKEKLLEEKKERQGKYYFYRDQKKELDTVCTNIHTALGLANDRPVLKHEREERG